MKFEPIVHEAADEIAGARGLAFGILFSLPIWALVGLLFYLF